MRGWVSDYLERYGQGFTLYKFIRGNENSFNAMKVLAESQSSQLCMFVPVDIDANGKAYEGIERVEPSGQGLENMLKILDDYYGKQIRTYIAGQPATSEPVTTGMNSDSAGVMERTFARLIKYDAINLEQSMTREFVKVIQQWTFPEETTTYKFKFSIDKPQIDEYLRAVNAFYAMGGAIDEDELRRNLGLQAPDEESKIMKMQPPAPDPIEPEKNMRALLELQKSVYEDSVPLEAAKNNAILILGLKPEDAAKLFPQPKPMALPATPGQSPEPESDNPFDQLLDNAAKEENPHPLSKLMSGISDEDLMALIGNKQPSKFALAEPKKKVDLDRQQDDDLTIDFEPDEPEDRNYQDREDDYDLAQQVPENEESPIQEEEREEPEEQVEPEQPQEEIEEQPEEDLEGDIEYQDSLYGNKQKIKARIDNVFQGAFADKTENQRHNILRRMAGAIEGSKLTFHIPVDFKNDNDAFAVTVEDDDYVSDRSFYRDTNGNLICHNDYFQVKGKQRGKGLGLHVFTTQVNELTKNGFTKIGTQAAGDRLSRDRGAFNGYITWPKFGYDCKLDSYDTSRMSPKFRNVKTIQELFAMEGGQAEWAQYGGTKNMEFSLEPGSLSQRVLAEYRRRKEAEGKLYEQR